MERLTDDRFLKEGFYQPKSKEEAKEIRNMANDLTFEKLYRHCAEVEKENAELQKQVDEWNSAFIPTRVKQQAVKDTAKEIFTDLLKEFSIRKSCGNADVVVREIAKQKGVEVE